MLKHLISPIGVAADVWGTLFVSDSGNATLRTATLAPVLNISHSGPEIVVSWSASLTNYFPQIATSPGAATWTTVTASPAGADELVRLTNSPQSAPAFYRLKRN